MIFMQIDGVQGESSDKGHKNWCEVISMSNAVNRKVAEGAVDTGRVRGSTTLGDIHVSKHLDKASVKLQEKCAAGEFIPKVEIHVCTRLADAEQTILKYVLHNVIVSQYDINCTDPTQSTPVETVSFDFEKIEWTYTEMDHHKGTKKGDVAGKYNAGKNSKS